ncbi:MAG: ABC transporter permease, partial [Bacteroidota bacterium]
DLQGDLYDLFYERVDTMGLRRSMYFFIYDVLRSSRFFKIRRPRLQINPAMFRNYLIVAFRNLLKYRLYTFINITGLAVGIASFILIYLHVVDEFSYDHFHEHSDRIVRIQEDLLNDDGLMTHNASTFAPLAAVLDDQVPAVEKSVRIFAMSNAASVDAAQFTNPETLDRYIEDQLYFVDSTFFEVFSYALDRGNPQQVLENPFSLLLSQEMAEKYFGQQNPIGKSLVLKDNDTNYSFTVTGILGESAGNSHFEFDFLASFSSLGQIMPWINNWHHPHLHTYALLNDRADLRDLNLQLADLPAKLFKKENADSRSYNAVPITKIHLSSHLENEIGRNGHLMYVYIFIVIAFLILLIASINFMNLATSNATKRAKEIGVRKTFGAKQGQLVQQFLSESFILSLFGLLLGVLLVELSLPSFNNILGKSLDVSYSSSWEIPLLLASIFVGVGFFSGLYPAVFLSSIRTISVLKGLNLKLGSSTYSFRKSLVVVQFFISCALIALTIVIQQQIHFIQNKNLGFNKEQILNIPLRDTENQMNYEPLKQRWLQHAGITGVTASSGVPTSDGLHDIQIKPQMAAFDSMEIMSLTVDPDFGAVYGLSFVQGRDFSIDFPSDAQQAVILNESAVKKLGWQDPIGKNIDVEYYFRGSKTKKAKVIGVVSDFNYHSLHRPVIPIVLHMIPKSYYHDYLSLKIRPEKVEQTLAYLESEWQSYNSSRPFEYQFLDATFAQLYVEETRLNRLFLFFTVIAIIIAGLGLFALASFECAQKTKEIGIRKVLGASTTSILAMLSKEFGKLVLISFLIALPISWLVAQQWLNNFAYTIKLNIGIFLLTGLLILAIAWLTISYHAVKSARANPIKALKYE